MGKSPQTIEGVTKKKELFMRLLTNAQKQAKGYERVVKECDILAARIVKEGKGKKRRRRLRFFPALMVIFLLLLGGCSGGAAFSASVGGSVHNPNHERLPEVVEATPIMSTSTNKQFALPMVGGGK